MGDNEFKPRPGWLKKDIEMAKKRVEKSFPPTPAPDREGELDDLLKENAQLTKLAHDKADKIDDLEREVAELREALELVLPLAKGYAAQHQVGSNARYVEIAEAAIKTKIKNRRTR